MSLHCRDADRLRRNGQTSHGARGARGVKWAAAAAMQSVYFVQIGCAPLSCSKAAHAADLDAWRTVGVVDLRDVGLLASVARVLYVPWLQCNCWMWQRCCMAFSLVLLRVVVLACMLALLVLNRTILAILYAPGVSRSNAFGFASMAALQSPPLRNDGAAIALRRAAVAATATLRCCRSAAFPPTTPNCAAPPHIVHSLPRLTHGHTRPSTTAP